MSQRRTCETLLLVLQGRSAPAELLAQAAGRLAQRHAV